MEQCKCPNCGAPINTARMICEYCGTTFKPDDILLASQLEPPKIVIQRPGVRVLEAGVAVDYWMLNHMSDTELAVYLKRQMAHEMAEKLMDAIQIEGYNVCCDDPLRMQRLFKARLRVLDPAFKF